ncbi:cytochrome P450 [Rhodobacteraceae bacterium]|nr:cytochrome P450 [Paracoccaceae bacterium]
MKHPKLGRKPPIGQHLEDQSHFKTFQTLETHSLLEIEPPDHTRLRKAAMRGFDRNHIAALAPDVSRTIDKLIDQFPSERFDFLDSFAHPLPALVITQFFGLPDEMAPQLQIWSHDMVAMYEARRSRDIEIKAEAAATAFSTYLRDVLAKRGATPGVDYLSALMRAEKDGDIKSQNELLSTVILLLNAGHEASVHALAHAVNLLADHPERTLALEPTNIANTVEECLRFAPPLHMFNRYVYEDVRILEHDFKAGQTVGCLLGSACRDDALWPDGDKFDPIRYRRSNLAFGSGIHACLGASLARLELQIALPALFSRCPDLKIAEPPKLADRYHFHAVERLMVDITPAATSST